MECQTYDCPEEWMVLNAEIINNIFEGMNKLILDRYN